MDLQTYLDNTLKAARAESFAASDQLTLGEIISKCEAIAARGYRCSDDREPTVQFDFEYAHPSCIDSWRGIYAELALGFEFDGPAMPLSKFIDMLTAAVSHTFEGYKGGSYTMSRHTPVWVANYGNVGNTAVIDVVDGGFRVVIITGFRES